MTDMTQGNILDELQWRGLIAQSTDEDALRTQLDEPSVVYVGFDPTGPSLHAGHLVPLLMLRRFQLAGHTPIILSGGATGLIGDPRDVGERVMNDESTVAQWSEKINVQLSKFVNLSGENAAIQANNLDWTSNLDVITFLRDIGKNFSLNTMLSRDTVKRRLESDGISYTEFSYMLLQANDFVELRRRYDCRIEIGGSDQWGNIVSGVDLNRRMDAEQVHGLTVPLVTDSEGNKFGKSTGGGKLWLDPDMTSPYTWYQYFFNTADADVMKYLRWFTFLDQETLDALQVEVEERPFKREAQRTLAREMTTLVHGLDAVGDVEKAAQALFGKAELSDLDEATLKGALSETTIIDVPTGTSIIDLLVDAGFADSKGAARRVIKEGGAYVNNERIADEDWVAKPEDFLHGQWLVLRKGKKNYAGGKLV